MERFKILFIMLCMTMTACAEEAAETVAENIDPVQHLTDWCYADWQQKDWKMGDSQVLAKDNAAFSQGIRKVCRARAELYAEGYEIYPFIGNDTQREIYAMVFSSSVEEIKSHIREYLPALQKI
ncbi:MAG TPA: hypothetical protein VFM76_04175 [Methylophaga sp.]|nr:hypothetical protein [Methylophaga sp.]